MDATDIIDLDQAELIAQGENRLVYQHPGQDNVLIKLPKSTSKDLRKLKTRWINRPALIRFGSLRTMQREQDEYVALLWRNGALPSFLPRLMGYCETSRGPGALVEKIVDVDGALAPTVKAFCQGGHATTAFADKLAAFFDDMADQGCIASGIHWGNIVVIDGGARFYLVDGLGEIVLIKTQWLSERLRRRNLEKQKQAMLVQVRKRLP
ncbi:YrbL family protein [uncultured Tateyamaria sp.]|uniref:YrbL family protein n=1 Tax=uncultured Tateyamaria sp. TaxID=455651 RepID=UPI00261A60E2|nr:YrbL family protein [uncultured Tateyamaria sp.]